MHQLEKLSLFLTSMSLEKNQIFFLDGVGCNTKETDWAGGMSDQFN